MTLPSIHYFLFPSFIICTLVKLLIISMEFTIITVNMVFNRNSRIFNVTTWNSINNLYPLFLRYCGTLLTKVTISMAPVTSSCLLFSV